MLPDELSSPYCVHVRTADVSFVSADVCGVVSWPRSSLAEGCLTNGAFVKSRECSRIFTVGYGGMTPDVFVKLARENDVTDITQYCIASFCIVSYIMWCNPPHMQMFTVSHNCSQIVLFCAVEPNDMQHWKIISICIRPGGPKSMYALVQYTLGWTICSSYDWFIMTSRINMI